MLPNEQKPEIENENSDQDVSQSSEIVTQSSYELEPDTIPDHIRSATLFTYERGGNWSPPLPIEVFKAWADHGIIIPDTKIRRIEPIEEVQDASQAFGKKMFAASHRTLLGNARGTKDTVDSLKKGAKGASEALETFAKALDEKKSLETINKLLSVSNSLAKLSSGLGLLGAALGVISIFSGEPSDTERILNAIDDLNDKVDSLRDTMISQFEKLEHEMKAQHAVTQLLAYLTKLSAIQRQVVGYVKAKDKPQQREEIAKRLMEYKTSDILECVEAIASQSVGKDFSTNIFEAFYQTTYGDISTIKDLGALLYSYSSFGLIADGLIRSLKDNQQAAPDPEKAKAAADVANSFYIPLIEKTQKAWDVYSNRCIKYYQPNMGNMVRTEEFHRLDYANPNAGYNLAAKIGEKYFWRDWFVVIYKAVGGFQNHLIDGAPRNVWKNVGPGKNTHLVIASTDNKAPLEGYNWDTQYNMFKGSHELADGKRFDEWKSYGRGKPTHISGYKEWDDLRDALKVMNKPLKQPQDLPYLIFMLRGVMNYSSSAYSSVHPSPSRWDDPWRLGQSWPKTKNQKYTVFVFK